MAPGKSLAEIALERYAADPWGAETMRAIDEFQRAAGIGPRRDLNRWAGGSPNCVPAPWSDLPYRKGRNMPSAWKAARYWSENGALGEIDLDGQPFCFRCLRESAASRWPEPRDTWNEAGRSLDRAHLIDRCEGGLDGPQNIVLLCGECHGGMPGFCPGDEDKAIKWVLAGRELRLWTPRAARAGSWGRPRRDAGPGAQDPLKRAVRSALLRFADFLYELAG